MNAKDIQKLEDDYRNIAPVARDYYEIGMWHPFEDDPDFRATRVFNRKPEAWKYLEGATERQGYTRITNGRSFFDNNTRRTAMLLTDDRLLALLAQIEETPGFVSYHFDDYRSCYADRTDITITYSTITCRLLQSCYVDRTDITITYSTKDDISVVTSRLLQMPKIAESMEINTDACRQYGRYITVGITVRWEHKRANKKQTNA